MLRCSTSESLIAATGTISTPRERDAGIYEGGTNKTIGQELGISPRTVELRLCQRASGH
ncbi:MAG TPA: LuxR C-terminal-related transcriptional regulator [Enterovirga sp.]